MNRKVPSESSIERDHRAFFEAVGRAVRKWAEVESAMSSLFHALLGGDQIRARMVWASLTNFRARHDMVAWFADQFLEGPDLETCNRLLARAKRLSKRRNMIAHQLGGFATEDDVSFFTDQSAGGNGFFHAQKMTLKDVVAMEPAIAALHYDLMRFFLDLIDGQRVCAQPKAWRELSPDLDP